MIKDIIKPYWLILMVTTIFCIGFVIVWPEEIHADINSAYKLPEIKTSRLYLNSIENMQAAGEYRIFMLRDDKWQKAGELSYDRFFRTREMEIKLLSDMERLLLRIEKHNGGASHIDCVLLDGKPPVWASDSVIDKISIKDFDVINAHGREIYVAFDTKSLSKNNAIFSLTARIEGERISKVPFQYPRDNTFRPMNEGAEFYSYRLGSKDGKLNPDGDLKGEELGDPFFAEYIPVASGHPQGTTYGWVLNDDENLYVAIDFTADNTMDGGEDYTKVYVKNGTGLKAFKISMMERKWGMPGFTYTDKVVYQHKTYEFVIPLSELAVNKIDTRENTLQIAFAAYGTASPGDHEPDLAYDSNRNRYLLVYLNVVDADPDEYDIRGICLDASGASIDSSFPICTEENIQYQPSVTFDSTNNRFLVVWQDGRNASNDIYGQLVNADGTLYPTPGDSTTNMPLCTVGNEQGGPVVAFDSTSSRFLVAWEDGRNASYDIYGQLVNADGTLYPTPGDSTTNFPICTEDLSQYSPSVAFDSTNKRFLVAWEDYRGAPDDIYGQFVDEDGILYPTPGDSTTNFQISTAVESQRRASVVFDSANDRFLVVWFDNRIGSLSDIHGQLVNAVGALYPTPGDTETNSPICTAENWQEFPTVAFDSRNNRFLVAWRDSRSGSSNDIYGQLVDENGALYPAPEDSVTNFSISNDDYDQGDQSVDFNSFCGNFLVAYGDTDGAGNYYITTSNIGGCSPDQGLLTFPVGMDAGVTPETGSVGDTLTFQVYYWGVGGPTLAELWVDLNSDGSYASARSFPIVIVPPDSIIILKVLMILSGMAGIALLLVVKKRRPVFLIASLFLVIVLIAVAGIIGCETTPQDQEQEPEPVPERFTLNEADTSDTNYLDGKLYTLDVTLDTNKSGSYNYKFVFTDWNGSDAYGVPTEEKTITID